MQYSTIKVMRGHLQKRSSVTCFYDIGKYLFNRRILKYLKFIKFTERVEIINDDRKVPKDISIYTFFKSPNSFSVPLKLQKQKKLLPH